MNDIAKKYTVCTTLFATTIAMVLTFIPVANAEESSDRTRADKLFEYFDKNGDGVLNKKEKILAKRAHKASDINNDGKISPREYKLAKKKYDRIDINDDGKVSKREYKFYKKHKN